MSNGAHSSRCSITAATSSREISDSAASIWWIRQNGSRRYKTRSGLGIR
jgi:hypothetical protein